MDKSVSKRMSREERRRQILHNALDVFTEKGYNGATTQDIAKAADISEVTLFRYFESKKQIFKEAIEPVLIDSLQESIVATKELDPIKKLGCILKERIKFISKHHKVIKLILIEDQINPEVADFNYIEKILFLLKELKREVGNKFNDDSFFLRLLMGSILSFLYLPEMDENKVGEYIDNFIRTFAD